MPRFLADDAKDTGFASGASPMMMMTTRGSGLQTLKRGRPMEPRVVTTPCLLKCCAERKDVASSSFADACLSCPSLVLKDTSCVQDQGFPEDEFDDDFDLGPPPPCGPVLVRQNAMDLTASAEAKFATLSRKMEMKAAPMPVMMPSRGASVTLPAPMLFRHSRNMPMN